ncbi:MAG: ATP-binding protein [Candidatus Thermoplasmatota archaeon]|nr:ATP-binding protein [Candidatus Thermoplasmatota archaeon]
MFVGRQTELHDLDAVLRRPVTQMVRVYGRRRLGKTVLLQELLRQHEGLYFEVEEGEKALHLETLSEQLALQLGRTAHPYRSWDDFLDELEESRRRVVVFDEFQFLLTPRSGLAGRLKDRWDRVWRKSGPSVIVCGSSVGMMQHLTHGRSGPLFGRLTADAHIRPMRYAAVREFYPRLPEEEKVARYGVFGGTPFYHSLGLAGTLEEAIRRTMLEEYPPMLDEPGQVIRTELRSPARATSILAALGAGRRNLHDLETKVGVQPGGLNWYLPILEEDLDLVRPELPVDERRKLTRYVISDPFFEFYYRFVAPNRAAIEAGQGSVVWKSIQEGLEGYLGRVFERVVREILESARGRALKGEKFDYEKLGPWWDRAGNEVDLVALGPKELWAVEVKWSSKPIDARGVGELLTKLPQLESRFHRGTRLLVVARNGCTKEAEEMLRKRHGLSLNLQDLTSILEQAP